jgi:RNA polymerase sigma factor (sigma-70 family)
LNLRRYRAERLLREEFDGLRGTVIALARGQLRARGVRLDASDLEACYAQAWHGLYTAVLDGQEIANPGGWLATVTFRRAIDEHRTRERVQRVSAQAHGGARNTATNAPRTRAASDACSAEQDDLAAALDDRVRLRQLFEALRGRLSERELQAAALCYLQGLSRAEAAAHIGVSQARMQKLMEGHGPGRPGVAGKVGALVEMIRAGGWCEEQGSLMRGLAFGILDPAGERYRLAIIHRGECPACRSYVRSLRGLAAVLPPVPSLLHWSVGAGSVTAGSAGAATSAGAGVGAAVSGSGAGASVAGGSWLLGGGPAGVKLAIGCVLALGVGAGCVALTDPARPRAPVHGRGWTHHHDVGIAAGNWGADRASVTEGGLGVLGGAQRADASASGYLTSTSSLSSAGRVSREFGPEQAAAGRTPRFFTSSRRAQPGAKSASAAEEGVAAAESSQVRSSSADATPPAGRQSLGPPSAAQREFAPG